MTEPLDKMSDGMTFEGVFIICGGGKEYGCSRCKKMKQYLCALTTQFVAVKEYFSPAVSGGKVFDRHDVVSLVRTHTIAVNRVSHVVSGLSMYRSRHMHGR